MTYCQLPIANCQLLAVLAVAVLLGCSSSPPPPRKTIQLPLPGGGQHVITSIASPGGARLSRAAVVSAAPEFKAAAARLAVLLWRYDLPQGTVPSNYWWNLQRSTDVRHWTVMASNVSEIPIIETTGERGFFRLQGRP